MAARAGEIVIDKKWCPHIPPVLGSIDDALEFVSPILTSPIIPKPEQSGTVEPHVLPHHVGKCCTVNIRVMIPGFYCCLLHAYTHRSNHSIFVHLTGVGVGVLVARKSILLFTFHFIGPRTQFVGRPDDDRSRVCLSLSLCLAHSNHLPLSSGKRANIWRELVSFIKRLVGV